MKTLCMDSAHKYLVIGLYEDDKLICGCANLSWKKQSETIFPELMRLMAEANWTSDTIDAVVISEGPGSYTGVRIAMSVAKVLCTRKKIALYTISTLQLYAGMKENILVMLDARSTRAYYGVLSHGQFVEPETILTLTQIQERLDAKAYTVVGDGELLDIEVPTVDFLANFIALKQMWKKVENIHTLVPRYLKEQDAYKVK